MSPRPQLRSENCQLQAVRPLVEQSHWTLLLHQPLRGHQALCFKEDVVYPTVNHPRNIWGLGRYLE